MPARRPTAYSTPTTLPVSTGSRPVARRCAKAAGGAGGAARQAGRLSAGGQLLLRPACMQQGGHSTRQRNPLCRVLNQRHSCLQGSTGPAARRVRSAAERAPALPSARTHPGPCWRAPRPWRHSPWLAPPRCPPSAAAAPARAACSGRHRRAAWGGERHGAPSGAQRRGLQPWAAACPAARLPCRRPHAPTGRPGAHLCVKEAMLFQRKQPSTSTSPT